MAFEYDIDLLEESRNTAYSIDEVVSRRAADGWRIHTWHVLAHGWEGTGENHGRAHRMVMRVSVLWEREKPE